MGRIVRWGAVGSGWIAHMFANTMRAVKDSEILGIADSSREMAEKYQKEFSIPRVFASPLELVQSPVNVRLTLIGIFVIASFMAGVVGILEAARTAGATNNYGNGYELDAIAACVVGGVSLTGGVGKVGGIVIGVLIFTVIQYGLSFVGLNPQWQQVIKGVIIAVAVALDMAKYSKR